MLRIYLDTNLITKISNYPLLEETLELYSDYLNVVYSSAHLDDLKRSTDADKTELDLSIIKKYSKNQCLAKYWGIEDITYDIRDPFEFFESFTNPSFDLKEALTNFDNECNKLGIENPLDKLKNLSIAIPEKSDEINPDSTNPFFKRFRDNPTFASLFEDIAETLQQALNSSDLLKTARNNFDKHLPRKVIGNKKENIIEYLNIELSKTKLNKSLDEYVLQSLKLGNKDKSYSQFDWFITRYYCLDLVGYKSDNNSTTSNLITDAFHAFYGAHCDIFLSEDKKLKEKAKVVYEEFGIETIIWSANEFSEFIDKLIKKIADGKSLVDIILQLRSHPIKATYSNLDNKATITEYFLEAFFIGYFDTAFWVDTSDGSTIIHFIKDNRTFSKWFYFKELTSLIKICIELFGTDVNNNTFLNEEIEFLDQNNWIGRKWAFENFLIQLNKDKELGFTLRFDIYTNRA